MRDPFLLNNCLLFVVWDWILYYPTTKIQFNGKVPERMKSQNVTPLLEYLRTSAS